MSCPRPSTDEHWLHPQPNVEVRQRRGGAMPPGVGAGGRLLGVSVGGRQQRAELSGSRNPRQSLGGNQAVPIPQRRQLRSWGAALLFIPVT